MKTAVAVLLLGAVSVSAQTPPPAASSRPLATVDGQAISDAEVEALLGSRLSEIRNQEYALKRRALDELIARRLLKAEAQRRNISEEELERLEVVGRITPVTEAEKRKLYEDNKARLGSMTEEEALRKAGEYLTDQRTRERRLAYVRELRAKGGVKVLLDAPRYDVSVDDDPARGPADAAVTIIEFSDFQCPFCNRAVPIVKQLEERYGKNLRVVFRDLPLVQIHQNAAKAAEAGACANEQGKFWEMHDRLFANQNALGVEDLKKHAAAIGLAAQPFAQCLDSGKYTAEWQKDTEAAMAIGISSTPAFLVNGRLISGALPLDTFVEMIDEELERAGIAPPAAPAPSTPASAPASPSPDAQ